MLPKLGDDLEELSSAVEEAKRWLDSNEDGTADEFKAKKAEVEKALKPLEALHKGGGGGGGGADSDDADFDEDMDFDDNDDEEL